MAAEGEPEKQTMGQVRWCDGCGVVLSKGFRIHPTAHCVTL